MNASNPKESKWVRPRPLWGWITALSESPALMTLSYRSTSDQHLQTCCGSAQEEGAELSSVLCLPVHTQHGKVPDSRQSCNKSLSRDPTPTGTCSSCQDSSSVKHLEKHLCFLFLIPSRASPPGIFPTRKSEQICMYNSFSA